MKKYVQPPLAALRQDSTTSACSGPEQRYRNWFGGCPVYLTLPVPAPRLGKKGARVTQRSETCLTGSPTTSLCWRIRSRWPSSNESQERIHRAGKTTPLPP